MDECTEFFKTQPWCEIFDSITPLTKTEWIQLLPNTRFFLAKGAGVNRDLLNATDGAASTTHYWIIAFQNGQMYEINRFPDLLSTNGITVTTENRQSVAQAFVLMALPYYIENDVVFLDAQQANKEIDFEQYNYETTVWTKLHGLQIDYYFLFDAARLRSVVGYIVQYQTGEGYM